MVNIYVIIKVGKSAKEASLEGRRAQGIKFHLVKPEKHFGLQVGIEEIGIEINGIEEIGLRKEIWGEDTQAYQL